MPVKLDTRARDRSSYTIECAFTDEDGTAITPSSLTWTLLSPAGAVVNGREDVAVASPSATENITLLAADLAYADGSFRWLILDWTYNSSYGTDLAGREQVTISIVDIQEKAA